MKTYKQFLQESEKDDLSNLFQNALHQLSKDKDKDLRRVVASNPSTHPDTLHVLGKDEDKGVRNAALEKLKVKGLKESEKPEDPIKAAQEQMLRPDQPLYQRMMVAFARSRNGDNTHLHKIAKEVGGEVESYYQNHHHIIVTGERAKHWASKLEDHGFDHVYHDEDAAGASHGYVHPGYKLSVDRQDGGRDHQLLVFSAS